MEKILHVNKTPCIRHTPQDTFPFVILEHLEYTHEWLYTNFININLTGFSEEIVNYPVQKINHSCPFFETYSFPYEVINNEKFVLIDTIEKAINQCYYVSLEINMNHIKNYKLSRNVFHNIHIYGYDSEKRIFYVFDFFRDKLSFETCSYDEMYKGFRRGSGLESQQSKSKK